VVRLETAGIAGLDRRGPSSLGPDAAEMCELSGAIGADLGVCSGG